jgi:hypothetical protein
MLTVFTASLAHAGKPLTVDDADVLAKKSCEIETYGTHINSFGSVSRGLQSTLNCGVSSITQLGVTLGGTHDDFGSTSIFALSGKTRILEGEKETPSFTLGYGVSQSKAPSSHWSSPQYAASVIGTFPLSEKTTAHLNLGLVHDNASDSRKTRGTWGIAGEYEMTPAVTLLAESYGEQTSSPTLGLGVRWQVSKQWKIGTEVSRQSHTATQFTLGATFSF